MPDGSVVDRPRRRVAWCGDCGSPFTPAKARGRPPRRCPRCAEPAEPAPVPTSAPPAPATAKVARHPREDNAPRPCDACGAPLPRLADTSTCSSCRAIAEGAALAAGDDRTRVKPVPLEPGVVRSSDGTVVDLRPGAPAQRDARGRVICRACSTPDRVITIDPAFMSCGCDPGWLDDDGLPCDPRFRPGGELGGMFDGPTSEGT